MSILPLLFLGLAQGVRHAFEPDHIAAVGVFVAEERNARRVPLIGAVWGAGHTATLLVAGILAWRLGAVFPPWLGRVFEGLVVVILIGLGTTAILRSGGGRLVMHTHLHRHGAVVHAHTHAHVAAGPAKGEHTHFRRPAIMGIIHGLAGTGALTLLVAAAAPSALAAALYLIVFGVGSAAGMTIASTVLGVPGSVLARSEVLLRRVKFAAGFVSIVVGGVLLGSVLRG